jgi:outer membrane protein assembly factor BamB
MRRFALALAIAAAGCSSSSGPKPAPLPRLDNAAEVRVLWSADVGDAERFLFSPAYAGDSVFAAANDGTVVRLNAKNGDELWRISLEQRLAGGVGADALTVAVSTADGEVMALDAASGKLRWRARVSSEVLAPPTVGDGLVVARSIDNRLFAFGDQDGKRRWVYQRAPSSLIVRAPAAVTLSSDTAFAGFSGGKLAAIALANGALRWEATVALPKGATELERVADVIGGPVLVGRELCAAAYQSRVACYESANGKQIWARELAAMTGVALDARYAFIADEKSAVHALDRSNGRSVWKQDKLAYRQVSQPFAAGSAVVVGDFEGYVHFLARESGAFITRYATGGGALRSAPVAIPGGFVVQTQKGRLFALAL